MRERDAAPARGAAANAILQVHVRRGERHDGNAEARTSLDRRRCNVLSLQRKIAAVPAGHAPLKVVSFDGGRDPRQGESCQIIGFVDVQVYIQAARPRLHEKLVEQPVDLLDRAVIDAG